MKLQEIETKIAALKKRYSDLDEKLIPNRDGVIDGAVASAMSSVDAELSRLHRLREGALVDDLIKENIEPPVQPSPIQPLPLPVDFAHDPDADVDPIDGLNCLPEDQKELGDIHAKLFGYCIQLVTNFVKAAKSSDKVTHSVQYTQAEHSGMLLALSFVMTQSRMVGALGRDRRNALEAKLLARIEAIEARPVLRYAGTWDSETQNNEADIVTDHGSAWYCERSTRTRPPSADWVLMVKKGRDAREAK